MYIGPWQEYNLSKKSTANKVNAHLRPSIEQALLSTLDPEAAKKAMEAMTPYFEKQSYMGAPTHNPTIPLHMRAAREQTQRIPRANPSSVSVRHSSMAAAGERLVRASSPLSVRSTKSEPIRFSYTMSTALTPTPKPPHISTPSNHGAYATNTTMSNMSPLPHTQPAYNASAMLNLLRLERNTQARSQIAKLTGWKVESSNLSDNANIGRKSKAELASDQKLEQVNVMKRLYMSGGQAQVSKTALLTEYPPAHSQENPLKLTSDNLARLNNEVSIQQKESNLQPQGGVSGTSQMLSDSALKTPRITDMDLTDEAFGMISKYFQPGELSTKATSLSAEQIVHGEDRFTPGHGVVEQSLLAHPTQKRVQNDASGSHTPMNDDLVSDMGSPGLAQRTVDGGRVPSDNSVVAGMSVTLSPNESGQEVDEQCTLGMESLLLWSSQLELDTA